MTTDIGHEALIPVLPYYCSGVVGGIATTGTTLRCPGRPFTGAYFVSWREGAAFVVVHFRD